jgi:hypothetical protein
MAEPFARDGQEASHSGLKEGASLAEVVFWDLKYHNPIMLKIAYFLSVFLFSSDFLVPFLITAKAFFVHEFKWA